MAVDQQPKVAQPVKVTDLSAVIQRFKETWQGVTNWFSPGEPIAPVQPEPEPRQRQVQVGQNIIYVPRAGESTSFEQLRFFASNYDVARLCIQKRKEQMAGLEWDIAAKDEGEGDQCAEQIKAAKAFFEFPDGQHDWPTWLGMLIEDRLAIDAVTIYPRPNRGGGLYALELLDGATFKVLVDYRGRVPDPPAPAYQQILWGTPRGMWAADQILYLPQNVRTHSVYGWSEIEGILYTVNTALRKRMQDLAHFTESNIPRAFMGVPESWTVDQIRKYQEFLDEYLAGDIARRSRIIMAPAGGRGQIPIHEMTAFSGDPQFDLWLLKITCAAMGMTPSEIGFTDDVNRATSMGQADVQYRTSINPLGKYIASIINRVLRRNMGLPQLQFKWLYAENHDELAEAQRDEIHFRNGALGLDEWREQLGRKPYGVPPFLLLSTGPMLIDQIGKEPPALGPDGMPLNGPTPTDGQPRGEGINQDPAEGNGAGGDDAPSSGASGDTSPLAGGNEGGKAAGVVSISPVARDDAWRILTKAHQFGVVMATLPFEAAAPVQAIGLTIPDADLADDGRETQPHITVKYGLRTDDPDDVRRALNGVGPLALRLGKTSVFSLPEYDVVWIGVDCPDLHFLHERLRDVGDAAPDSHDAYVPHVTVAYVKPGLGQQYAGIDTLVNYPVTIDRLIFRDQQDGATEILLAAKAMGTEVGERTVAYQAARDDLRRWRQVAVKAVRSSLPQRSFQTEHIPPHLYAEIVGELDTLTLIAQPDRVPRVQATFAKALEVLNQAEGPRPRAGSRQR